MSVHKLHKLRRVFIGIKLSEELIPEFIKLQSELGKLPARFIPPEDIHLTLVPPFETVDIEATKDLLHRTLKDIYQFKLRFLHLEYNADYKKPRFAWVVCTASKELISLKKKLLSAFNLVQKEKVSFIPHMTVARFNSEIERIKYRRLNTRRPIKLFMYVDSIKLFESPHKGGVGYEVVESVHLKPENGIPD